jgi:hypothetical protein
MLTPKLASGANIRLKQTGKISATRALIVLTEDGGSHSHT